MLTVEFTVLGIRCLGLNGGPAFKHSEAFSFQVATEDQAETDRYWNAIVGNGGQESMCGWCKDKWGLSWQITPIALSKAIGDPDPGAASALRGDDEDEEDRHRHDRGGTSRLKVPCLGLIECANDTALGYCPTYVVPIASSMRRTRAQSSL